MKHIYLFMYLNIDVITINSCLSTPLALSHKYAFHFHSLKVLSNFPYDFYLPSLYLFIDTIELL